MVGDRQTEARPILITVDAAARMLSISRSNVYALIYRGKIPARRIGTAVRIRAADLDHYVDTLPRVGPAVPVDLAEWRDIAGR